MRQSHRTSESVMHAFAGMTDLIRAFLNNSRNK